jgi:hypothetical protein
VHASKHNPPAPNATSQNTSCLDCTSRLNNLSGTPLLGDISMNAAAHSDANRDRSEMRASNLIAGGSAASLGHVRSRPNLVLGDGRVVLVLGKQEDLRTSLMLFYLDIARDPLCLTTFLKR